MTINKVWICCAICAAGFIFHAGQVSAHSNSNDDARGKVVDEAALLAALADGRVGAAALDCFHHEPLPPESPFWALPNVLITPHSAGETGQYETNVVDILVDNIERLLRGETALRNQVV